jgi:hypothetical protein
MRGYDPQRDHVEVPENLRDVASPMDIGLDSPLQFEQRVLYPSRYPVLEEGDGKGQSWIATHKMANAEVTLKSGEPPTPIAYPTVVYGNDGSLKELSPDEAFDRALQTGEYRKFDSPDAAALYAEGLYKRAWGKGDSLEASMKQLQGGGR